MDEYPERPDPSRAIDTDGESKSCILYPVFREISPVVLHVAASLAETTGSRLVVGHVDDDSTGTDLEASRDAALTLLRARKDPLVDAPIESHSILGPSPLEAITTAAASYDPDYVVLGHDMPDELESSIAGRLGCDTVVVNEHGSTEPIESILVPIAGGPHTDAVVAVASALAQANDARVELLHVTSADPGSDALDAARDLLDDAAASVSDAVPVETPLASASDPVDRVIEESASFDVTIIGAPTKNRLARFVLGSRATTIRENAENTVAMVRGN